MAGGLKMSAKIIDGKIIADESVYSVLSNDEIIEKANSLGEDIEE